MARKSFTEHPEFIAASHAASGAILGAAMRLGVDINSFALEASVNRAADDLTRILLRAYDEKQDRTQSSHAA